MKTKVMHNVAIGERTIAIWCICSGLPPPTLCTLFQSLFSTCSLLGVSPVLSGNVQQRKVKKYQERCGKVFQGGEPQGGEKKKEITVTLFSLGLLGQLYQVNTSVRVSGSLKPLKDSSTGKCSWWRLPSTNLTLC